MVDRYHKTRQYRKIKWIYLMKTERYTGALCIVYIYIVKTLHIKNICTKHMFTNTLPTLLRRFSF